MKTVKGGAVAAAQKQTASFTPPKQSLGKRLKKSWQLYLFVAPALIGLIIFSYIPMYGILLAFKDYSPFLGIMGSEWVGLEHFQRFFNSPYFVQLLRNTLVISLYGLLVGFPIPIILALGLNSVRNMKFKKTVQTVTYAPYFISTVVMCGIIKVFCMQDGLFAQIASAFGGVAENYLANPRYFRTIYVASDIWQKIGWDSIIYLAALSAIDQEQYEAARVDGANRFQQMLHITLPGLIPTIMILFILRMGNILNVGYEKVLLLYNATTYEVADIISTYTYRLSFPTSGGSPMYSKSTAIGLFNTLVNVVFLLITNAISKKATESSLF